MKKLFKIKKTGSALVVTLVVLGVIMVTALAISFAAIQGRKASMGSSRTTIAYQNAESGVERAMQMIKDMDQAGMKISETNFSAYGLQCMQDNGFGQYNLKSTGTTGLYYEIELRDGDEEGDAHKIKCNDSEKTFSDVRKIKVVGYDNGESRNNARAIETAVASVVSQKVCAIGINDNSSAAGFIDLLNVPYSWTESDCVNHALETLPCVPETDGASCDFVSPNLVFNLSCLSSNGIKTYKHVLFDLNDCSPNKEEGVTCGYQSSSENAENNCGW